MTRKAILGLGALAATLFGSQTASAQEAHGMAEKGNFIISADRIVPLFSFTRVSHTQTDPGRTENDVTTASSLSILPGTDLLAANVHTIPRIGFDFVVIPN